LPSKWNLEVGFYWNNNGRDRRMGTDAIIGSGNVMALIFLTRKINILIFKRLIFGNF